MTGSAILARKILIRWQVLPSIKLPTKVIPQERKRKAKNKWFFFEMTNKIVKWQSCCGVLRFWSVYRLKFSHVKSYEISITGK